MNIGDVVKNFRTGRLGVVIRLSCNGSITVLEKIAPFVTCTHDSEKWLEVVEERGVPIYDTRSLGRDPLWQE